jgi:GNAT superfamily N-acetyltransferase
MNAQTAAQGWGLPFLHDPIHQRWRESLGSLSSATPLIREAHPTAEDGLRVRDLQFACEPITIRSVEENIEAAARQEVLIAEIDGIHVGLCMSHIGDGGSAPLFVQVVGVVPEAQRRGVATAMLAVAARQALDRNIALATQDSNTAARSMILRFAESIGAKAHRASLDVFRARDLGIRRGDGYRAWLLERDVG